MAADESDDTDHTHASCRPLVAAVWISDTDGRAIGCSGLTARGRGALSATTGAALPDSLARSVLLSLRR
jgi:hypothetical protein